MRRFLLFSTTVLLAITFLHSPVVRTQDPPGRSRLPRPEDYPLAGPNCKDKQRLSTGVTTPAVEFTKTARCELLLHTCEGPKTTTSEVRDLSRTLCADYWAAAKALQGREVCCDKPEKEEKKPVDCQEKDQKGNPPWFDPSAPGCQDLQDTRMTLKRRVAAHVCKHQS